MRRLARIRRPASIIPHPIPPPPPSMRCLVPRKFSTCQSRKLTASTPCWQDKTPASTKVATEAEPAAAANEQEALGVQVQAEEDDQYYAEEVYSPAGVETDLGLPPEMSTAPRSDEVLDSSYTPATSSEGLEEVGGLEGWWDQEGHWSGTMAFSLFAPREKITEPKLLEAVVRRAVVEALIVQEGSTSPADLTARWRVGGREAALRALAVQIEVSEDGSAKLAPGTDKASITELLGDIIAPPGEHQDGTPSLEAGEAAEIADTWDPSWKKISLRNMRLKFAITKRVHQLSGQMIHDSKLPSINTVSSLIATIVRPPKPTKLAEEIKSRGHLLELPNVKAYDRRVTPIDKDKMVGSWKVIVSELEKRELPVTGSGKYGRSVEKTWLKGRA